MPKVILPQKNPADVMLAVFDFSSYVEIVGTTISSAAVTCSVYSGTDLTPSTMVGATTISGYRVTVPINGGTSGNMYSLSCAATYNTGLVQTLTGFLSILPGVL